jgi:hypothetical protein
MTEGKSFFCIPESLCEAASAEASPFLVAQIFENIRDQGGNDLRGYEGQNVYHFKGSYF